MTVVAVGRTVRKVIATINAMVAEVEIADAVAVVAKMRPLAHQLATRQKPPTPNKHVLVNKIVVAEANHVMIVQRAPKYWK